MAGWEGRAAVPVCRDNSPSQETGGVSIRKHTPGARFRTTFSSRARGRGGNMRLHRFAYLFFASVFGTLFVQPVITHAQRTATVHGTVTDPSGAAISGAEVTAQAIGTRSLALRRQTGADGSFSFALAPGKYRLSIRHIAFASVEQEFALTVGETRTWEVRLHLEKMSSKVVVSDTAEPTTA